MIIAIQTHHRRAIVFAAAFALVIAMLPGASARAVSRPAATVPITFSWVAPTQGDSVILASAGSTIPITFSLGGDLGLEVLHEGHPKSQRYDCATGAKIPDSQYATHPFGAAGINYDAGTDVYTYAWQTREEWSNTCRRFQMRLSDGTLHTAEFRLETFRFNAPTVRLPKTNRATAGALVPVRFSLALTAGMDIFAPASPRSRRIDCATDAPVGEWARTTPRGTAGLTRDATTHDYAYAWQTNAAWAETCRRFEMTLRNGSTQALRFQFNRAPHAIDDGGAGFTAGSRSPFTTASVLTNDSDIDGDTLSVSAVDTTGTLGAVTDYGDGTFGYDPDGQFPDLAVGEQASDAFGYTISDGHGNTDAATVTITVLYGNQAPVNPTPYADLSGVAETDIAVTDLGPITDPDAGTDQVQVTLTVEHGAIHVSTWVLEGLETDGVFDNDTGTVVIRSYLHQINTTFLHANGVIYQSTYDDLATSDTLTVTTDDLGSNGAGGSLTDTDSLTIILSPAAPHPDNEPPVNVVPGSTVVTTSMTDTAIAGLSISDPDADPSTDYVQVTLSAAHGTLVVDGGLYDGIDSDEIAGNGTATVTIVSSIDRINSTFAQADPYGHIGLTYRSDDGFVGYQQTADVVTVVTDDLGNNGTGPNETDTDTFAINVSAPPVANDDTATVAQDSGATTIDVLFNDTDDDGGPAIEIVSASDPEHGTVELTGGAPGHATGLTYSPDSGYCDGVPDTFTYTLNGTSTATVEVTVTCPG